MVKNPPVNAGDISDSGLIPGPGRFPGGGKGYPLQYPCLENPMDRGAWRAAVYRVTQSRTRLKRLRCTCTWQKTREGPPISHTLSQPHIHISEGDLLGWQGSCSRTWSLLTAEKVQVYATNEKR